MSSYYSDLELIIKASPEIKEKFVKEVASLRYENIGTVGWTISNMMNIPYSSLQLDEINRVHQFVIDHDLHEEPVVYSEDDEESSDDEDF